MAIRVSRPPRSASAAGSSVGTTSTASQGNGATNASNFPYDVNTSGAVDSLDVSDTKQRSGLSI